MKDINMDSFRLSIAWPRVIPCKYINVFETLLHRCMFNCGFQIDINLCWMILRKTKTDGKRERGVSEEGIKFYNDVIDELLANEITPLVTIFHWDIPQDLEDEYGGFLSEQIM